MAKKRPKRIQTPKDIQHLIDPRTSATNKVKDTIMTE